MTAALPDQGRLQELRALIAGLPSGARLVAALEGLEQGDGQLTSLVTQVIKEVKAAGPTGGAEAPRLSIADASTVITQLSFLHPRGKHDLAFFPDRLLVKTAKADVVVPYPAIHHIAILDSIPKDTKGRALLYLHLAKDAKVLNGKVALQAVVIQVSATQQLSVPHPGGAPGERLEGLAAVVLCQAFGLVGVAPTIFCSPDPEHFSSSDGCAAVQAAVKARQGFLFPLPAGLCFVESPALFIPRASIRCLELARAGGASSTFDLYVHSTDGATHEFCQIPRAEVGAMEGYARAAALRLGPPPDDSGDEAGGSAGSSDDAQDSDSDDPDDEDFDPEGGSDEEEEAAARKKRKRGGSRDGSPAADGASPAAGGEGGDDGAEQSEDDDSSEDDESSSDDDSDDSGSVELVSEDEFSTGQLRSMIDTEKQEQGKKGKRSKPGEDAPEDE